MSGVLTREPHSPTGLAEMAEVRTVSPAPEHLRVSVFAPRQQLDITLPADARVADVLPYLSRLIARRGSEVVDPSTAADSRSERTVLRRESSDGPALFEESTLREAGVRQGDMLFLGTERTLVPPRLHDDVVDAAAQLNRTVHASWDRVSAAVMACVALCACTVVLIWLTLGERFDGARPVIVGVDAVAALAVLTVSTVAHRLHHARQVAALFAWAAALLATMAISVPASALRDWGPVLTAVSAIAVGYGCYRLAGTGRWGLLAGSVLAAFAAVVWTVRALTPVPDRWLGALTCMIALALCASVPKVNSARHRLRHGTSTPAARSGDGGDPFGEHGPPSPAPVDRVPTAEQIAAGGRRLSEIRAGLYAGAGAAVIFGVVTMLAAAPAGRWAEPAFAALCGVVLLLRARLSDDLTERWCQLIPGAAAVLLATVEMTGGPQAFAIVGLAALAVIVGVCTAAGVQAGTSRWAARLDYLEYLAVAALLPLWVAVVDGYLRVQELWR